MSRKVILLMTDTTRADMLGCYGNPDMYTPNLDRLAAEGIRFSQAYTTQPVCHRSRCVILLEATLTPAPDGPTAWDCPTMSRISDAA